MSEIRAGKSSLGQDLLIDLVIFTVNEGCLTALTLGMTPAGPNTDTGTANCGMQAPGTASCWTRLLAPVIFTDPSCRIPEAIPVASLICRS